MRGAGAPSSRSRSTRARTSRASTELRRAQLTRSSTRPVRKLWLTDSRPIYAAFSGLVGRRPTAAGSRPSRPGHADRAQHRGADARRDLLAPGPSRARRWRAGTRTARAARAGRRPSMIEPVRAREPPEDRGERIEEDDLDVEDDERHRDQVELHREALGRLVLGHDAALVRRFLRRRRPLRAEERRRDERQRARRARRARSCGGSAGSRARPATPSSSRSSTRQALLRAGYPNGAPTMPARRGRDRQTSSSDLHAVEALARRRAS